MISSLLSINRDNLAFIEDNYSGARSKPYFPSILSMHLHSVHLHNVSSNVGQSKLSSNSPSTLLALHRLYCPHHFCLLLYHHNSWSFLLSCFTYCIPFISKIPLLCVIIPSLIIYASHMVVECVQYVLNRRFQFCRNIHMYMSGIGWEALICRNTK